MDDPLRQWKLSPMDLPSRSKWFDYSRARDMMLESDGHQTRAVVHLAFGRQETSPAQLPRAHPEPDTLQESTA